MVKSSPGEAKALSVRYLTIALGLVRITSDVDASKLRQPDKMVGCPSKAEVPNFRPVSFAPGKAIPRSNIGVFKWRNNRPFRGHPPNTKNHREKVP